MTRPRLPALSSHALLLAGVGFVVAFGNFTFFSRVLAVFPPHGAVVLGLISLVASLAALTTLFLIPLTLGRAVKPVLSVVLLLTALTAYFMDSYGVAIGTDMLRNVAETQWAEIADLLTLKLLVYLVLICILPVWLIWLVPIKWRGWRWEIGVRLGLALALLLVIGAGVMGAGDFYASFIREHKELRAYANPAYPLTAAIKYAGMNLGFSGIQSDVSPIGTDAQIGSSDHHRELIFLVVGETARADRFSLNGYARDTTPRLRAEKALSLTNFWACGSSTAVSVPCMFSSLGMQKFDPRRALQQENLLDVAQRAGVNVLWLDNNSSSKGVAARVPSIDYRTPKNNPRCDTECRDVGMLDSLQQYIREHPKGDILIVLHQMGNHGPAYYKRYPPEFEKFLPACHNNDLTQCSVEEIGNAYDNAILYTDYFLGQTIELLKANDADFETTLIYLSDHGESLGENGIFLHGLPRVLAPDNQFHVPAVLWFGPGNPDVDVEALAAKRNLRFTHDNLFHTVLGLLEVETSVYRKELDILDGARRPE